MKSHILSKKFLRILSIFIIIFGAIIPEILADDCQIVNEVFNLLDISNTINEKLNNLNIVSPTCCDLEAIHCSNINNEYVVDKVELRNFDIKNIDLSFVIEKLSLLKNLYFLSFAENNLNLYIPNNLYKIKSLRTLSFRGNKMIGTIPESIGDVPSLTYLDLSDNNLEGELPSSLSKLTNLNYLNLNGNNFRGVIPDSLKKLEHLKQLHLDHTELSGYIPNFPELNDCNYENTKLCVLKNSKCKSSASECSNEEIWETRKKNGYRGSFLEVLSILTCILIISLIIFFVYKKKSKKSKKRNNKNIIKIKSKTNNNNDTNNNNTNNNNSNDSIEVDIDQLLENNKNTNSKSADIIIMPIIKNVDKYEIVENLHNNNNNKDNNKMKMKMKSTSSSNTVVNGHSVVNNSKIKPVKLFSTRTNSTTSTHDLNHPKNESPSPSPSVSSSSLLSYSALYDTNGLGFDELINLNTISNTNTIDIVDAEARNLNNNINTFTNTNTNNTNTNTTNNNNNNYSRRTLTKHEEAELYSSQPTYEDGPPSY